MSELINQNRRSFRWQLLTTVSALSLTVTLSANAETSDKPTVWIELGGQLERIGGKEDAYLPPFTTLSPTPGPYLAIPPSEAQKSSIYSYGAEGKISLRPQGSKWEFSAAVRYGRSSNNKHTHQQTKITTRYPQNNPFCGTTCPPYKTVEAPQFADFRVKNDESHAILDFQVGRDVGLGRLSSVVNFGVRVADFSSRSQVNMIARPNVGFFLRYQLGKYQHLPEHTDYQAVSDNERSFHGIGPSLSWNGDVRVAGDEDGAVTFDWGVNAAMLFGRQRAKGAHHESANYYTGLGTFSTPNYGAKPVYNHPVLAHDRTRSVIVPNVGGLAGISVRYSAAKISFGYRADFFLGAMDMGIDARDTKDRNFYGPFATLSIGLGG
jgi:iron complex outermembrane receptor protein